MVNSIDECFWHNKYNMKDHPQYISVIKQCNKECNGLNINCPTYRSKKKIEEEINGNTKKKYIKPLLGKKGE